MAGQPLANPNPLLAAFHLLPGTRRTSLFAYTLHFTLPLYAPWALNIYLSMNMQIKLFTRNLHVFTRPACDTRPARSLARSVFGLSVAALVIVCNKRDNLLFCLLDCLSVVLYSRSCDLFFFHYFLTRINGGRRMRGVLKYVK